MRTRRGTKILSSDLTKTLLVFSPGDIVTSVICGSVDFVGKVTRIDPKCVKVYVDWGSGMESQHDPEEIRLSMFDSKSDQDKMNITSSRRGILAEDDAPNGNQFMGDPETHGIDKPRGGGFSIMQDLQKELAPESRSEAEEGPKVAGKEPGVRDGTGPYGRRNRKDMQECLFEEEKVASERQRISSIVEVVTTSWNDDGSIKRTLDTHWDDDVTESDDMPVVASHREATVSIAKKWIDMDIRDKGRKSSSLRSRRALYWGAPGRTYRMTKNEQEQGVHICPRCKGEMEQQPFTKSEKLVTCPGCGFKVPSGKLVTERPKVEVEVSPEGGVEVEIEASSTRRGRWAMEFDTPEAMKKYLHDHPKADKSKHHVKKSPDKTNERIPVPKFEDIKPYEPSDDEKREMEDVNYQEAVKMIERSYGGANRVKEILGEAKKRKDEIRTTLEQWKTHKTMPKDIVDGWEQEIGRLPYQIKGIEKALSEKETDKKASTRRGAAEVPLCARCAEVRWRTGTLPGSKGNTHPSRLGRHVKLARSCRDCGKQAYRLYSNS
jgi:DNA-directed RNA polymerase subunit RPC12/RpoP